jgi:hypothetical protein
MFHNTLVVGSSPTSSTTQSSPTGESGLVQFGLVERAAREFLIGAKRRRRIRPAAFGKSRAGLGPSRRLVPFQTSTPEP